MGQQQLLLIVLGVIIVGIAIAVGITMFSSSSVSANRDAVVNDLNNLASKAQQYWRKPAEMAGGNRSFLNFALDTRDTANANGSYSVNVTADMVLITGVGKEIGNDKTTGVKVIDTVYADRVGAKVLN